MHLHVAACACLLLLQAVLSVLRREPITASLHPAMLHDTSIRDPIRLQGKGIRLVQTPEQLREALEEMNTCEVVMSRYRHTPLHLQTRAASNFLER